MLGEKKINIEFVESHQQRYSTCGDYWETETTHEFRITKQMSPDRNMLILFHEMCEYYLCEKKGVTEQEIMDFDLKWEKGPKVEEEPGNCKELNGLANPYYNEHRFSENIERQLAHESSIDWFDYEQKLII